MNTLDSHLANAALRATGEALARRGISGPIQLVLAGGTAGLLAGWFRPSRVTGDCDVLWHGDEPGWRSIAAAAAEIAGPLGLPQAWLSREASIYAWCLPIGWQSRCEPVRNFGPLHVARISRIDLIAAKVMGSPVRPQDLEDLQDLNPTRRELDLILQNLDRLEAEHLDGATFPEQRAIVLSLGGER